MHTRCQIHTQEHNPARTFIHTRAHTRTYTHARTNTHTHTHARTHLALEVVRPLAEGDARAGGRHAEVGQPAAARRRLVVEAAAPEAALEVAPARALLHAHFRHLAAVVQGEHVVWQAAEQLLEGACTRQRDDGEWRKIKLSVRRQT